VSEHNNIQAIEAYLSGSLTKEQSMAFEHSLSKDTVLAEDYAIYKSIYDDPPTIEETSFINNIETLRTEINRPEKSLTKLWLLIPVLTALFLLSKLAFQSNNKSELNKEKKEETITPLKETPTPAEAKPIEQAKVLIPPKSKTEIQSDEKVESKSEIAQDTDSALLAEANFTVNPKIESILTKRITRSSNEYFKIISKQADLKYSPDNPAKLEIKGELTVSSKLEASDIGMYLFSNKIDAYDSFLPLLTIAPTIKKVENKQYLTINKLATLKPGLYYYLIEFKDSEELVFVGKFEIR